MGSILDEHMSSLFEKQGPIFFVAAPSRENEQVVVCIWGWAKAEDAKNYLLVRHLAVFDSAADQISYQSEGFRHFQKAGEGLYNGVEEYQAKLKKWEAAK